MGRPKGSPNKVTQDVRAAIAKFAEAGAPHLWKWLQEVEAPEKRIELWARVVEYHIPKLGRTEVTGKDGEPVKVIEILSYKRETT